MATRSYIGKQQSDGTIRSVYCHWDGYPDGVGKTLVKFYTDEQNVDALIDMGDISSLAPEIGLRNSFDHRDDNFCVFYTRDRGEELQVDVHENFKEYLKSAYSVDYTYLFVDQKWKCFDGVKEIDLYGDHTW
jgi:hypothetical protein